MERGIAHRGPGHRESRRSARTELDSNRGQRIRADHQEIGGAVSLQPQGAHRFGPGGAVEQANAQGTALGVAYAGQLALRHLDRQARDPRRHIARGAVRTERRSERRSHEGPQQSERRSRDDEQQRRPHGTPRQEPERAIERQEGGRGEHARAQNPVERPQHHQEHGRKADPEQHAGAGSIAQVREEGDHQGRKYTRHYLPADEEPGSSIQEMRVEQRQVKIRGPALETASHPSPSKHPAGEDQTGPEE